MLMNAKKEEEEEEENPTLLCRSLHRRVIYIFLAHCFDFTACKVNVFEQPNCRSGRLFAAETL